MPSAGRQLRGVQVSNIMVVSANAPYKTVLDVARTPRVPTMVEAGVPGFEMTAWGGIIASVKMPAALVKRMNGEINKALASQTLRDRCASADSETTGGSPQDFRALVERELKRWGEVVRKAVIKPD